MDIKTDSRFLTPEEVLLIFQEDHRIFSVWNEEANPSAELTMCSSIVDWYDAADIVQGKELGEYLNQRFEINISSTVWEGCLEPCWNKQLKDVCELIAQYAQIEKVKPITIFGQECLSATLFYFLKNKLSDKGMDVTELKPSSLLEPYLKKSKGALFDLINKNYPGIIPEIRIEGVKYYYKIQLYSLAGFIVTLILGFQLSFLWIISILCIPLYFFSLYKCTKEIEQKMNKLYIPGILTFRDLIEKIIEERKY